MLFYTINIITTSLEHEKNDCFWTRITQITRILIASQYFQSKKIVLFKFKKSVFKKYNSCSKNNSSSKKTYSEKSVCVFHNSPCAIEPWISMASTALTMVVIGACATCLRHIRCPISVIAPTLGIRTASERQEALQTLLSFICRGAACLLPCWHNVRRPSRTLFRKRHNTTHNIYGHLVIWSFGHLLRMKKKKCVKTSIV